MTRRLAGARARDQAGFTGIELLVVVAVIGVIMAAASPFFLSYLRTSALRAGAEEMSAVLGRARQLAISDNTSMCVTDDDDPTRVRYRIGSCTGPVWTGPGTNASGFIRLGNDIQASGDNVVFTYIGTATTTGTYTVTNPRDGKTLTVVVTAAGRISIQP
jgi:prepilin-type N-terminal cleavage/methylation domain-containing protein